MGLRAAWDALWTPAAKAMPGGNTTRPIVSTGGYASSWGYPRDRFDLSREAGDFRDNSVIAVSRNWLKRQMPSCTLEVGEAETGSEWEAYPDHPLVTLLRRPNPYQSSRVLWDGTTDCLVIDGYAYWVKVRDGAGQVVEVWWVPSAQIAPEWGGPAQVKGYWYQPSIGQRRWIDAWDIVHFRIGTDSANPAQGCSPLKEQIRSIVGINAGERYTSAVLRRAHSGKMVVPKEIVGQVDPGTPEEAEMIATARKLERDTGGEMAGGFTYTSLPVDLLDSGLGPEEMLIDRILDRPESMIVAALGLNALVLGLPSSANTRTYANLAEANKQAWENAVIPLQDAMAEDGIQHQLLFACDERGKVFAEFDNTPEESQCWWNRAEVAALKEDANERSQRATTLYAGGIATLNEVRSLVDLPPVDGPEGDLRYGELTPEQEAEKQANAELMAQRLAGASTTPDEDEDEDEELVPAGRNGQAGRNGSTTDD
jgi:hypothetical protein